MPLRPSRWTGASWTDPLPLSKTRPDQWYVDWREATAYGRPHLRTVELKGYRITWKEEDPAWSRTGPSGIRLGHVAELLADPEGNFRVMTRSRREAGRNAGGGGGDEVSFTAEGADVVVEGDSSVHVRAGEVARIEFGPAPEGTAPASSRPYGTAEDRTGRSFTGFVTWDGEIPESHLLDGLRDAGFRSCPDSNGRGPDIRSSGIRLVEPTPSGARLTFGSRGTVEFCRQPRAEDPPPVRIADPALGFVEVSWGALRILRLEPSPGTPGYDTFDGGHLLFGSVRTTEDEEIEGRIRWDADEEWSWEPLDGSSHDVVFSVEFGKVARIARDEGPGARVTLLDGRSMHLTGGSDVDEDNMGIFIFPVAADRTADDEPDGEWRYVAWEDFLEARFRHGATRRTGS